MKKITASWWLAGLILAFSPVWAAAQAEKVKGEEPSALEGIWPSERLTKLMLSRWAEEAAQEYELDEEQTSRLQGSTVDRWSKFLKENRREIQPVLNDFIEMRFEPEPPSKERIQAWADRAMPVYEGFRDQINGGMNDFREVLKPLQRAKFEREVLEFSAGLQIAEAKIKQWQRGEYEENEFWEPPPSERRRRREARRAERAAAEGKPIEVKAKDQIGDEVDAWDRYVEQFSRLYELDEAQKATARSALEELKARALSHRDRNRGRIDELERRIRENEGTDEELATIKNQLVELYGPVDEMFKELQARLEAIPSSEQKARMIQREIED